MYYEEEKKASTPAVLDIGDILNMDAEQQQVLNNSIDTLQLKQKGGDVVNIDSLGGGITHSYHTESYRYNASYS